MSDTPVKMEGKALLRAMLARMDSAELDALHSAAATDQIQVWIVDERQYRADTRERDRRFDSYEHHHGSGEAP